MDKIKNRLHPYLYNNPISPFLDIAERKIHLDRSILVLGIFLQIFFAFYNIFFHLGPLGILASYLVIGWGNDFVCNFLGIIYPVFAS